jgi:exodeoxyribonuclease V alpha subunit
VIFAFNDASQMLKHAFAITTHRSQGQEWDVVIMALAREHGIMLQRQLLYTAVTRARKKVILIGEWQAVSKAVATERVTTRYTRLSELLT